ncbi:MAG: nuclear transport factor 2 family protein [Actinobacteria bacterium]|nr:nuclear transport factor 2 family protein [Actinomycetota bacterium]
MAVSPADQLAILELVTQLYRSLDDHEVDAIVTLFTDDGSFSHPHASVGRDELGAFLKGWIEGGEEESSLHVPGIPIFVGEGESEPTVKMVVSKYKLDPPSFLGASDLTVMARRVGDEWKIVRFEIAGREGA